MSTRLKYNLWKNIYKIIYFIFPDEDDIKMSYIENKSKLTLDPKFKLRDYVNQCGQTRLKKNTAPKDRVGPS